MLPITWLLIIFFNCIAKLLTFWNFTRKKIFWPIVLLFFFKKKNSPSLHFIFSLPCGRVVHFALPLCFHFHSFNLWCRQHLEEFTLFVFMRRSCQAVITYGFTLYHTDTYCRSWFVSEGDKTPSNNSTGLWSRKMEQNSLCSTAALLRWEPITEFSKRQFPLISSWRRNLKLNSLSGTFLGV